MPIEIRELIIRATVSDSAPSGNTAPTSGGQESQALNAAQLAAQLAEMLRKRNER